MMESEDLAEEREVRERRMREMRTREAMEASFGGNRLFLVRLSACDCDCDCDCWSTQAFFVVAREENSERCIGGNVPTRGRLGLDGKYWRRESVMAVR